MELIGQLAVVAQGWVKVGVLPVCQFDIVGYS